MKLNIEIEIEIVEEIDNNTIARVYYPNEGNKIEITKGLNVIHLSDALFHEIGHLIDWYISNEKQCDDIEIRELNADTIGDSLRFKCNSYENIIANDFDNQ